MAVYRTVSSKEVIGRFLRRTRITDSSFIDDIWEWLPEAMDKLKTRNQLDPKWAELTVVNHCVKLPCGLYSLDAVVYNGNRLREGSSVASVHNMPSLNTNFNSAVTSVYEPDTNITIENHLDVRVSGSDLQLATQFDHSEYYKLQLDYIQTSFEEGTIVVYFLKRPIDEQGYVLIPDNEDYKEALYWYLRMMVIEAGWEDPLFTWDKCYDLFYNIHGPRAITDISYPSVDTIERIKQSTTRLIPAQHFYEDFFTNSEQVQQYNK